MVKRQDPGEDAYAVVMDTMTVSIQKLTIVDQLSSMRSGSSGTRLTVTGASNSSGDIKLPDMSGHLSDGQDYGVKVTLLLVLNNFGPKISALLYEVYRRAIVVSLALGSAPASIMVMDLEILCPYK